MDISISDSAVHDFLECPSCGYEMDRSARVGSGGTERVSPSPGDAAVCAKCGSILTYGEGLRFSAMTANELADLILSGEVDSFRVILNVRKAVLKINESKGEDA